MDKINLDITKYTCKELEEIFNIDIGSNANDISEQIQTGYPSIKYTGNEGQQPSQQHQQEMMIAQQIWEGMRPEQQAQFQSFEQFFSSGIWKQILQQMQADEAQGQAQGIAGLGPRTEEVEEIGIESLRGNN